MPRKRFHFLEVSHLFLIGILVYDLGKISQMSSDHRLLFLSFLGSDESHLPAKTLLFLNDLKCQQMLILKLRYIESCSLKSFIIIPTNLLSLDFLELTFFGLPVKDKYISIYTDIYEYLQNNERVKAVLV